MLKADLHIHTEYSMDSDTPLGKIANYCQEIGINCIAISDHGTIEGALKLRDIAPFRVIVAEEILTPHGEIMGLFLEEKIPSGLSVEETLSQIKAQGGLVNIPHPFDIFRRSALETKVLEEIVEQIDIIEVYNSKAYFPRNSAKARAFADKYKIIKSAGSDAHTLHQIGNAYVEMPEFKGRDDFLLSLAKGRIVGHKTNPISHLGSAWARLKSSFKRR